MTVEALEALLRVPSPIIVAPAGEEGPKIQVAHASRVTLGGANLDYLETPAILHTQRHLDLTDEDVHVLTQYSSSLLTLEEAIPIVVVTIQVLAGMLSLKKVLHRWEVEMPDLGVPNLNVSAGLADKLRPWEGFNYWTFDSWALAVDVVSAFVGQPGTMTETAFLEQMSDVTTQATGLGW